MKLLADGIELSLRGISFKFSAEISRYIMKIYILVCDMRENQRQTQFRFKRTNLQIQLIRAEFPQAHETTWMRKKIPHA